MMSHNWVTLAPSGHLLLMTTPLCIMAKKSLSNSVSSRGVESTRQAARGFSSRKGPRMTNRPRCWTGDAISVLHYLILISVQLLLMPCFVGAGGGEARCEPGPGAVDQQGVSAGRVQPGCAHGAPGAGNPRDHAAARARHEASGAAGPAQAGMSVSGVSPGTMT